MNTCDPYDSIMSDNGFNVQDLFVPSIVKINIPEFFREKSHVRDISFTASQNCKQEGPCRACDWSGKDLQNNLNSFGQHSLRAPRSPYHSYFVLV